MSIQVKEYRVKKTFYSRTRIKRFPFFLALMSQSRTPEAEGFHGQAELDALLLAQRTFYTAAYILRVQPLVPLNTAALPVSSFQGHRCWQWP